MLVERTEAALLVVVFLQHNIVVNAGRVVLVVKHAALVLHLYPGPTNTAGRRTYEGSG